VQGRQTLWPNAAQGHQCFLPGQPFSFLGEIGRFVSSTGDHGFAALRLGVAQRDGSVVQGGAGGPIGMNSADQPHGRSVVFLGLLALLAGCGSPPPRQVHARGAPVLRAIYRDAAQHLLVVLPERGHPLPPGDCAAPLLVDDASGQARQISRAEAAERMKRMQLSGAVHGTCP
jgi:hypothetical protein